MHYREQLLDFEDKTLCVLHHYYDEVQYKKLSEVAYVERGKRVVRKQLNSFHGTPVYQNSLTPLGYYSKCNYDGETVFVIGAGAAGEIGFSSTEFWAADDCYPILCKENVLSKYLYYLLLVKQGYIKAQVRKASIPRLSRKVIENIKVPVPSLEAQQQIVDILDKFDALVNDISQGLPAEIEARRKQYEYYRDKLLTFKEKVN